MSDLFVACLCAAWCGTCRTYQPGFEAMQVRFPQVAFAWIDIEESPDVVDELDVENFPSIVIQRGRNVLFYGPMLPQIGLLERLIQTYLAQTEDEARAYVQGSDERRGWQGLADIRGRLPG